MIRVLLLPSSDYLGHPFPQRHNHIFEKVHDGRKFEVHVIRFKLYKGKKVEANTIVHELPEFQMKSLSLYYLVNMPLHGSLITNLIEKLSIDVVVLSNLAPAFAITLLVKNRVPLVFDLQDYYPTSAAGYITRVDTLLGTIARNGFEMILKYMIKRSKVVTAASKVLAEYAKELGARKTVQVPNGVDGQFFRKYDSQGIREKLGIESNEIVVGYIGSIEFWLDMETLIHGVAKAIKRGISLRLLLIGGKLHTNYIERVSRWIKEARIENKTIWLDFISYKEVPKYISVMDFATIPFNVNNSTAYYAGPNKIWEYLAQAKPILATPIPEILYDGSYINIVKTADNYTDVITRYTKDPTSFIEKAKEGQVKARLRMWENSSQLMKNILEKAVGG